MWEEEQWFYKWERMLGLVWTQDDLESLARTAEKKDLSETELSQIPVDSLPSTLRYPLSLLVRPELFKELQERALPAGSGLYGMPHVPQDAVSLSQASKTEFLRRLGVSPVHSDDLGTGQASDPFAQSRRPREGFSEGRARPLGGGGRRK